MNFSTLHFSNVSWNTFWKIRICSFKKWLFYGVIHFFPSHHSIIIMVHCTERRYIIAFLSLTKFSFGAITTINAFRIKKIFNFKMLFQIFSVYPFPNLWEDFTITKYGKLNLLKIRASLQRKFGVFAPDFKKKNIHFTKTCVRKSHRKLKDFWESHF